MNIIFVSDSVRHQVSLPTISSQEARNLISTSLRGTGEVGLDFETTGLDPLKDQLLLTAINTKDCIYVIDNTSVATVNLLPEEGLTNHLTIAHHAKFECKFCSLNHIKLGAVYCTMIAEQRLIQGSGRSASLVETCMRRKVSLPQGMDKDIRNEFIGADPATIVFTDKTIIYAAGDTEVLFDIKVSQDKLIQRANQDYLVNQIEMPLIKILAESEITGWAHNSEAWLAYAQERTDEANLIAQQLTQEIINRGVNIAEINPKLVDKAKKREARKLVIEKSLEKLHVMLRAFVINNKTHLKAYQVSQDRFDKLVTEQSELNVLVDTSTDTINWGSSKQVIEVFNRLNIPMPMAKDKITKKMKPSMGKEARSMWLSTHKEHLHLDFFQLFDGWKKVAHIINAFGYKWVQKYVHPVTNRVHPYYKQMETGTGRLACGDAKNGFPNLQQIPAKKELRSCFIADPGTELVTADLSGAELINMCSLADDKHLYSLFIEYDDIHSSILTKAWRKIWKQRGNLELAETFTVSKTENSDYRRKGKNGTFAGIYGCFPSKMATTLDITVKEAELYLETLDEELTPTMNFVKAQAKSAVKDGFVIHNDRTNSRRWFIKALIANSYDEEMSFRDESSTVSSARNSAIQSTQAEQIKEAIVYIDIYNKQHQLDIQFKVSVHDELVYQYPIGLEVTCPFTNETIPYAEFIGRAMVNTANLYLREPYKMKVDYHTANHWLK